MASGRRCAGVYLRHHRCNPGIHVAWTQLNLRVLCCKDPEQLVGKGLANSLDAFKVQIHRIKHLQPVRDALGLSARLQRLAVCMGQALVLQLLRHQLVLRRPPRLRQ